MSTNENALYIYYKGDSIGWAAPIGQKKAAGYGSPMAVP